MDTLSLEELQAQFKNVQQKAASHRLSERNCVEVIMKLIDLGLLKVIFTLNGREYITHPRLEREIQDEVVQHRGRLAVTELQPLLNIDLAHINVKVEELIRKRQTFSNKQLQFNLIDGELISEHYLEGIAEEINGSLQDQGQLSVAALAKKYRMDTHFLSVSLIGKRLGKIIKGQLEGDILFTSSFVARYTSQLVGLFSAITRPTSLSQIISSYNLQQESLFYATVASLVKEGRVRGSINGERERGIYVPDIFETSRRNYVSNFLNQNHYISYATVEKLQYANARAFLEKTFGGENGIALPTCFVSRSVVDQLDAVCAESIATDSFLDLLNAVPSVPLDDSDVMQLLQTKACESVQLIKGLYTRNTATNGNNNSNNNNNNNNNNNTGNAVVLVDQYLVSRGMLDKAVNMYHEAIKEHLEKTIILAPVQPAQTATAAPTATTSPQQQSRFDDEDETDYPPNPKPGKGSRGGKGSKASKQEEEEQPQTSSQKSKRGKDKEDKQEKQQQSLSSSSSASGGKRGNAGSSGKAAGKGSKASSGNEDESQAIAYFTKWFRDAPSELLRDLYQYLAPTLQQIKQDETRAANAIIMNRHAAENEAEGTVGAGSATSGATGGVVSAKQKRLEFQENLNTLYANIQLFKKGIATLPEEALALEKHLLKTLCNDLVNLILINQAALAGVTVPSPTTSTNTESQLSAADQKQLLSQLPSHVQQATKKIITLTNGKSTDEFLTELSNIADKLELHLKPLDKRREKQLLTMHEETYLTQLSHDTNPATCLQVVVVLLYLRKFDVVLHAPGRCVAAILAQLSPAPPAAPAPSSKGSKNKEGGDKEGAASSVATVIPAAVHSQLVEFHAKVIKFLTEKQNSNNNNSTTSEAETWLNEHLADLKQIPTQIK